MCSDMYLVCGAVVWVWLKGFGMTSLLLPLCANTDFVPTWLILLTAWNGGGGHLFFYKALHKCFKEFILIVCIINETQKEGFFTLFWNNYIIHVIQQNNFKKWPSSSAINLGVLDLHKVYKQRRLPSLEGQAEEVVPSQFHCDRNSAGTLGLPGSAPEAKFQNFTVLNRKNNY